MDEFPASNVVDGDPTSSWLSPPLSAGEQFRRVSVDLDLGHVSNIAQSFTLCFT